MEPFNKIVLGVAAVILILVLIYLGIVMLYYKKAAQPFPPVAAKCPDYWKYDAQTNLCTANTRNKGVGTVVAPKGVSTSPMSFDPKHTGWSAGASNPICNQRKWANSNGIEWDGVSNYTGCA